VNNAAGGARGRRNVEGTLLVLLLLAGMVLVSALVVAVVWLTVRRSMDKDEVDRSGQPPP
jgi:hypothetical protein